MLCDNVDHYGCKWIWRGMVDEAKGEIIMMEWIESPFFGILCSLISFELALWIQKKTKLLVMNPLLLSIVFIIVFLMFTGIDVSVYQKGGDMINMFLGPVTVVLAVPLYQQLQSLKNYLIPILGGVLLGTCAAMISILICSVLLSFEPEVIASLLPKSVTTPIGIEISTQLGGIPSITVLNILVTGIIGTMIAEITFRIFRIKNPVAKGIALGTSAHAIGTSKAFQYGHVEGAMSSLAIGVAGLMSVVLAPLFWAVFQVLCP